MTDAPDQGPEMVAPAAVVDPTPVGATSDTTSQEELDARAAADATVATANAAENAPAPEPVVADNQQGGLEPANDTPAPVRPPTAQEAVAAARNLSETTEHFRKNIDPANGAVTIARLDWVGDDGLTYHPDYADELRGLI